MLLLHGFWMRSRAKSSTLVTVIPQAIATGRCRVIPNAFAREITVDRAAGLTACCSNEPARRRKRKINSRIVVVCASATETPRLLLNSKSKFFPSGIGNEHDQVGRNIENDGSFFRAWLFDHVVTDQVGPGVCFAVDDSSSGATAPGDWAA